MGLPGEKYVLFGPFFSQKCPKVLLQDCNVSVCSSLTPVFIHPLLQENSSGQFHLKAATVYFNLSCLVDRSLSFPCFRLCLISVKFLTFIGSVWKLFCPCELSTRDYPCCEQCVTNVSDNAFQFHPVVWFQSNFLFDFAGTGKIVVLFI